MNRAPGAKWVECKRGASRHGPVVRASLPLPGLRRGGALRESQLEPRPPELRRNSG
jgi:hypothetical protein